MKHNHINILSLLFISVLSLISVSCSDNDDSNPNELRSRCLKRTLGPNIVGNQIYFAYAMAMPYGSGQLESCTVEASIAGAEGTYLENNSYYTNSSGMDIPVQVGEPSINSGNKTTVKFNVDTCAATLRYYYKIPEDARGKEVTFTFTVKAKDGQTTSVNMGPYTISKQYLVRDITLTKARCYISIEDMTAYTLEEAQAKPEKIDLIYLWRNKTREGVEFGHSFASPVADKEWLDDVTVPETFTRDVKLRKEWGIIDGHLTDEPNYGTYIDDLDFETIQLDGMPNYCINMKQQGGMWIETKDGKYRAYIYINSLKSISGGVISIKRYNMK
ncbi:MAG: DUF4466 family protein [Prevotella sp.]|nr:DUF4466 family protein [Prevotella sp.]